jgi:Protein of unknown function (DUF2752)
VAVAAGYLALVDPNQPGHYPSCPILWVTGRYCPGCGGLRAVHDLLHGHLAAAVSANLMIVFMAPVMVTLWARWVLTRSAVISAESRWGRPVPPTLIWSLLVVIPLFWVLRNLPATAWLAPG